MPGVLSAEVDESTYRIGFGIYSDELGTSRLVWSFPIVAELDTDTPPTVAQGYIIVVDAHTGDVFVYDEIIGARVERKARGHSERSASKRIEARIMKIYFGDTDASKLFMLPPLEIDGVVYLHVGWLRSPLFGVPAARVAYDPALREVSVVFQGKRWRFSAGSNKVFSDNGEIVLPHPARNIRARIYLPLSAIEAHDRVGGGR